MECVNDAEALALLRSGRSIDLVCGDLDGSTKVDGTGLAAVLQHDFPRLKVLLGPAAGAHCRGLSDLEHTVKALLGRSP